MGTLAGPLHVAIPGAVPNAVAVRRTGQTGAEPCLRRVLADACRDLPEGGHDTGGALRGCMMATCCNASYVATDNGC